MNKTGADAYGGHGAQMMDQAETPGSGRRVAARFHQFGAGGRRGGDARRQSAGDRRLRRRPVAGWAHAHGPRRHRLCRRRARVENRQLRQCRAHHARRAFKPMPTTSAPPARSRARFRRNCPTASPMPSATIDGIQSRIEEEVGSSPPILMYLAGRLRRDAQIVDVLARHLRAHPTCWTHLSRRHSLHHVFDRRETGQLRRTGGADRLGPLCRPRARPSRPSLRHRSGPI